MLLASVAQAAELDLYAAPAHCLGAPARGVNRHGVSRQTFDRAAGLADEVRVPVFLMCAPRGRELETPHVIAVVRAVQERALGHIHEVSVERGAVEARVAELVCNLAVRHGAVVTFEDLEHGNARSRCPKAAAPE